MLCFDLSFEYWTAQNCTIFAESLIVHDDRLRMVVVAIRWWTRHHFAFFYRVLFEFRTPPNWMWQHNRRNPCAFIVNASISRLVNIIFISCLNEIYDRFWCWLAKNASNNEWSQIDQSEWKAIINSWLCFCATPPKSKWKSGNSCDKRNEEVPN